MKFIWEQIFGEDFFEDDFRITYRAKVFGGWIVRHKEVWGGSAGECLSMVFVPDPKHKWTIG